jgi:hypothetical protein
MPEEQTVDTIRDEDESVELVPPEGNKKVGRTVFQLLDAILQDKESLGLPRKWHYHERLAQNKHWKSSSKKASLRSANLLHTHRIESRNLLTANSPTFDVEKIGGSEIDEDKYMDLVHTTQHWWLSQEQHKIYSREVDTGEIAGCVVDKVRFDPDAEFGIGEAVAERIHPFYFGMWPLDCEDNQKADANFHFEPVPTRKLRKEYPNLAKQIKPDSEWLSKIGDSRKEIQAGGQGRMQRWFTSIGSVVKAMLGENTAGTASHLDKMTLAVECWVRDDTMVPMVEEREVADDQGRGTGQIEKIETGEQQLKYPGGIRYIRVCNGGELVLEDRGNPNINPNLPPEKAKWTYLYDKFPFTVTVSETNDSHPWGMSDFEQLEGLQVEINKTLSQINLFKDRAARLKIKNPMDSGVDNAELTNYPGIIRPSSYLTSKGIEYLQPPQAPIDMYKALEITKDLFFLVSGTFSLQQAQTEGREVIAYKAIAALLERVTDRLRGKFENYSRLVRERGRMYVSMVQNWYTEPRHITYTDESGEQVSKQIVGADLIFPAKMTVVSGSMMPTSRVQQREEALALYEKNALPLEELLKALNWPNWRQVVNKMNMGPLADMLQRLAELGMPEQLVGFLQELQTMEPKDFKKAMEKGELPDFQTMLQQIMGGEPQEDPMKVLEQQLKQAEIAKEDAEAQKVEAETDLAYEKVRSERVEQQVKSQGVDLDWSKLKIERAESIHRMNYEREQERDNRAKIVSDIMAQKSAEKRGQGPYRERGMKSNNQE